jgi:hypothetical protein
MARRGSNAFKRNDAVRALRSAAAGGIEPSLLEIIVPDGTVYRVYGNKTTPGTTSEVMNAAEWDAEIAKLKAKGAAKAK